VFWSSYVFVWKRCSNGAPVRESSVAHVPPSFEPSTRHSCGSRAGTSFALVKLYDETTAGVGSSACQSTCDGGPSMHHFVWLLPS